jgi:hypothetical protein
MSNLLKRDWVHTGVEYPKTWELAIQSVSERMSISKRAVMRQCLQIGLPILSRNAEELAQAVRSSVESRKTANANRNRPR